MKTLFIALFSFSSFALSPGKKAPDFSLYSHTGKKVSLSDHKGKTVILEWFNDGCPFVRKHYDSKNMQTLQGLESNDSNTVWLSIVSSAEGKQGYIRGVAEAKNMHKQEASKSNHLLLDPDGRVGRMYKAKTTPQMYIIDSEGILRYNGAIDSIASADQADIKEAKNYVKTAMYQLRNKQKISPSKTKPYGCSVKY